jgi:hypothetical protein
MKKAKRKAAGQGCLLMFHFLSSMAVKASLLADPFEPHGGMGLGLTEAERDFVNKQATDLHRKAEVWRRLGWRLLGKNH